jgi:chaperonin GroEL (HSP60 family)
MIDPSGNVKYPIKAISILKAHGKSAHDSQLIDGYAINLGRAAQVCVYVCVCVRSYTFVDYEVQASPIS